ncbi:kinesin-like protein KIF18A isoform X2 [Ochotona curzoniae]|nr:kinesin-like protein KIF18A isoform X2 [Ochotona curzoniae]
MHLNDSLSQELQPIVYTPEDSRKPLQNPSPVASHTMDFQDMSSNGNSGNSLKVLSEVDTTLNRGGECEEILDSTFTIDEDTRNSRSKLPEQESRPNNRKNALQSITSATEENHGFAKRVRPDNSSDKHLQENRPTMEYKRNIHKVNPRIVRKFGRNISQGNLR